MTDDDGLEPGDPCPACTNADHTFDEDGTVDEMQGTDDLSCTTCGSIFDPSGVAKMNNLRRGAPPWIDRHGEVDAVKKRRYEANDRGQYPDHYYDADSNRRL